MSSEPSSQWASKDSAKPAASSPSSRVAAETETLISPQPFLCHMATDTNPGKHIPARKRLEQKLNDIDRKLDHIIHRLREQDPRIPTYDTGLRNE